MKRWIICFLLAGFLAACGHKAQLELPVPQPADPEGSMPAPDPEMQAE